jgi:hypothetical protein
MKIAGKVTNKTENAEGHSQVRIASDVDLGDNTTRKAEFIISTPDAALVAMFKVGQSVSFEI